MEHSPLPPAPLPPDPAAPAPGPRAEPTGAVRPAAADGSPSGWRPADFEAVQECLALLGKAVRQFHTYPAASTFCSDAIAAAHAALAALSSRERLAFRVGPSYLLVDEIATVTGGGIEQDLARRLHRVQVAAVEMARTATPADLTRFCTDLSTYRESPRATASFAAWWTDQRVETIITRAAHRPVVIEAGTPRAVVQHLVAREQRRRQEQLATGGPVHHYFPPDKGWVLVDPSITYDSISLADLAVLLDDPAEVAVAMVRLSNEARAATIDPQTAFSEKFSDLATLFASVDPPLSQVLFSKLARSLLDLDEGRRTTLLRQTVLPGLLDATMDGAVLASFPDVDLADSLCLLLDLETAAPELLATAVDRLQLPAERRERLEPLLRERLHRRQATDEETRGHDVAIDRFARKLIALDPGQARRFAEYAPFDLTITEQTRAAVSGMARAIATTDGAESLLETVVQLVALETEAAAVTRYLQQFSTLLGTLEQQQRWSAVATWGGRMRTLERERRPTHPEVAEAMATGVRSFWTRARLAALAAMYEADREAPAIANALVDGFGAHLASAIIAGLDDSGASDAAFALLPLLGDHAAAVAPILVPRLATATGTTRLAIIRLLGLAGSAYGAKVAALLTKGDEETVREALRALVRMGSSAAATAVVRHVVAGPPPSRAVALEALLQFAPAQALPRVRELLANREFIQRYPALASQLLDYAARHRSADLRPTLQRVSALRFHFWNPALVKVARQATRLLSA